MGLSAFNRMRRLRAALDNGDAPKPDDTEQNTETPAEDNGDAPKRGRPPKEKEGG